MQTRTLWLWLLLIPDMALAGSASTPIVYSMTFPDASGAQKQVSFTGTASGTSLTGTLTVSGVSQQVSATIGADGSVSGKLLTSDGKQLATFTGVPNGPSSTMVSFNVNGKSGQWSVPVRVPAASSQ